MCKRIFKNETLEKGDISFYKIGTFGKKANAFISNKIYNEYKEKHSFPKMGDILISASGTIGRCVKYDGKPAYFQNSNIVWIDNNEKKILNNFLFYFYKIVKCQTTKGATISRLYNDNLRKIKIPLPPLPEQEKIVEVLEKLQEQTKQLEKNYQTEYNNLDELRKFFWRGLLEGRCFDKKNYYK